MLLKNLVTKYRTDNYNQERIITELRECFSWEKIAHDQMALRLQANDVDPSDIFREGLDEERVS